MTPRALLALTLSALTLGCAPDPKVVAQRTATDVKSLVREAWVTAETSNSWASLDSSLLALGVSAEARAHSMRVPPVNSLDSTLAPINKRIERVFTEANIVDKSGGALTFRLRGTDLCTGDNGELDAGCAEAVDRLKLHIKATGDLDLTLLVGESKAEAYTLEIRAGVSLALVVDLERSMAAMAALQGTSANTEFTGKGKMELRLHKNGKDDFTFSSSVLSPVTWKMTGADGISRSSTIGAKSPLASIRIEAPAKRATLHYGYGEARYVGLLRDFITSEATSTRPLDVFLSGAGFSLIFEEGKTARIEGAGLGTATSTIKSGNDLLFSIDFNKAQGRTVSATWEPTAKGFKLNFSPGLQVDAYVGLGAIESQTYVVAPEHRNATYAASFLAVGRSPSVEFFTAVRAEGTAFARLLEGELKLSVDDALIPARKFAAPSCLGWFTGTRTNTYVESVVSVACP